MKQIEIKGTQRKVNYCTIAKYLLGNHKLMFGICSLEACEGGFLPLKSRLRTSSSCPNTKLFK